jgi:DNA-binding MarR family transcriptional regulator
MSAAKDQATRGALLDAIEADFGTIMRHVAGWHVPEFLSVDVTMSQAKLLYLVAAQPGIVMSALAAQLGVGLSTVSGLVDRLVEHGYLERREDPADRRQQRVTVTEQGTSVIEHLREMNQRHMRTLLDGLSIPDLRALRTGIAALGRQAQRIDQATAPTRRRIEEAPA